MTTHYVCEGDCKHEQQIPGICESDFCNKKGEELKICGCEDGTHSAGESHSQETTEL